MSSKKRLRTEGRSPVEDEERESEKAEDEEEEEENEDSSDSSVESDLVRGQGWDG